MAPFLDFMMATLAAHKASFGDSPTYLVTSSLIMTKI